MNPHSHPEARCLTQDGWIWPRARMVMTSRDHIRSRMGEDIAAVHRRTGNDVAEVDLEAMGWTGAQIANHAAAAAAALRLTEETSA